MRRERSERAGPRVRRRRRLPLSSYRSSRAKAEASPASLPTRKLRFRVGVGYGAARGTCAGKARALLWCLREAVVPYRAGTGAFAAAPASVRLRVRLLRSALPSGLDGAAGRAFTTHSEGRSL